MLSQFKRNFYIEQQRLMGIHEVDGKPVQELNDCDLKYALTIAKIKAGE